MIAAAWLMLSSLLCSLQLQTGSFPKPLTREEEQHYLELSARVTWRQEISLSSGICAWWPIL